jgi:glycosyltransferase involved in cell wall biosynthesis
VKVVYVSSLEAGGPVTHLLDLAPRVAEAGVEVGVVCATDEIAGRLRARGVSAVVEPLRSPADLPGAARLRAHLTNADIVHTHDRRTGLLARPQAALAGSTVVHTFHGLPDSLFAAVVPVDAPLDSDGVGGLADQARLRAEAALSRIGTTVVPSHALARFLAAHGFPVERLRVIPNGVTVRRTEPRNEPGPVVVGTAAVLERRKGIDVLLGACTQIRGDYRLEIFGDGSLRGALEAAARAERVPARFHGHVPDGPGRLGELDVFVLPARAENLPMAILESMAWAVPVVATRVGGVPELVVDGATGLLVEPDDREALGAALEALVDDPGLRSSLGRAGAQRVATEFDSAIVAARMVALYEELLEARDR